MGLDKLKKSQMKEAPGWLSGIGVNRMATRCRHCGIILSPSCRLTPKEADKYAMEIA